MLSKALLLTAIAGALGCSTDMDCALNGLCTAGACVCDSPWGNDDCSSLQYKVTPASAKDIWTGDSNLNTWSGPILHDAAAGKYHFISPVYEHASLWSVLYIAHGVADAPTGPYDWTSMANISAPPSINPGGLVVRGRMRGCTAALAPQNT